MIAQFARATQNVNAIAPHMAPHAALLIDFDNVTMGIRSDITKELKNLLNSDVIKGKVAVQRAYADWRRYPQYVVPLAEASVDLIFAPAYGSSKKNATDIRLAIDALELVFTRSEIGTFILLSGDSDFSSLVLKLKEYGKYVVGVGIRESASDLLVQNCDEYYSYSALTGLTRAGDEQSIGASDPWELVELALQQMVSNGDVMRSDRLKQVILELDSNFDEKTLGFSKFNRFVMEAANRGVVKVQKLENGQYEIDVPDADADSSAKPERSSRRGRRGGSRKSTTVESRAPEVAAAPEPVAGRNETDDGSDRKAAVLSAYDLLCRAAGELGATVDRAVRDSDVKRRMLDHEPDWDESNLGFSKFSRFLRHAHDNEIINLRKVDNGNYEVALQAPRSDAAPSETRDTAAVASTAVQALAPDVAETVTTAARPAAKSVGARRGSKGRRPAEGPGFIEGQVVAPRKSAARAAPDGRSGIAAFGLPTGRDDVIAYLTKTYKGIGLKTAEALVDGVGPENVFTAMHTSADRVKEIVGVKRGETLLDAWQDDFAARSANAADPSARAVKASSPEENAARGRRGGRRRGGRGRKRPAPGKA